MSYIILKKEEYNTILHTFIRKNYQVVSIGMKSNIVMLLIFFIIS